jgi:hypothetical protein
MSFIAELSFLDLQRLRKIIRKVHLRYYPSELCSDREADRVIETIGPEVREKMIRRYVDAGLVQ